MRSDNAEMSCELRRTRTSLHIATKSALLTPWNIKSDVDSLDVDLTLCTFSIAKFDLNFISLRFTPFSLMIKTQDAFFLKLPGTFLGLTRQGGLHGTFMAWKSQEGPRG